MAINKTNVLVISRKYPCGLVKEFWVFVKPLKDLTTEKET